MSLKKYKIVDIPEELSSKKNNKKNNKKKSKKKKLTKEEWIEYRRLKVKNTKKCKYMGYDHLMHCPVCGYVVDHKVPTQTYCDRCGQRLED